MLLLLLLLLLLPQLQLINDKNVSTHSTSTPVVVGMQQQVNHRHGPFGHKRTFGRLPVGSKAGHLWCLLDQQGYSLPDCSLSFDHVNRGGLRTLTGHF